MNYATIKNCDIANGPGVRVSLFVSGCTHHCPGCFNPEERDFNCGRPFTKETIAEIHKMLANPVISGLSLLGGDPLCQDYGGIYDLIDLCFYTHSIGKTVWLWTGFIWEDCYNPLFPDKDEDDHSSAQMALLTSCDVVVDGPFKMELSDQMLKWCGSANQRVIDVQKTLRQKKVVLYEGEHYE